MDLNDTHFNAIGEDLVATLKELGVGSDLIDEVMAIVSSVHDDVLNIEQKVEKAPLFERIGGAGAVDAAVELFYNKVLADKRVNSFFQKVDMSK